VNLQVSVVVFLLHGYVSSSSAALRRTLLISGAISVVSTALEGIFIWPLHIQLYTFTGSDHDVIRGDMVWSKWAFWVANSLAFSVVYLGLMLLPLTRWRDLLPSKDMFHYYVRILFGVNLVCAALLLR
jgi:Predicted membrane protein